MAETRARRRIRRAVESRGFKVESIEWEPWYAGGEMEGICGGWYVVTNRPWNPNCNYGNEATGLSVDEVVAYIDYFFTPSEPCECGYDHFPFQSIKGEPQHPMHDPDCRWFISYRMPWWSKDGDRG